MPVITLGIQAAAILIPLAIDMIQKNNRPDGTPLTQEEIDQMRAFVDQQHLIIQELKP